MTLIPASYEGELSQSAETYEQAKSLHSNIIWKSLDTIMVQDAILHWLKTLSFHTERNYRAGMKKLVEYGLLNPFVSLQVFALVNHESVIDQIKLVNNWSEYTRQARAACYISFTAFLSRRLQGIIKKANTNKEKGSKTFFRVYDKVKTNAMNQSQWMRFFKAMDEINERDCLIAKVILQGGKRVNEVLCLQTHQIDWTKNEITFIQSKTKGCIKETVITYPESIMNTMRNYIGNRAGFVFVTRFGKPVDLKQLAITFSKAGERADIPFKVTPHVLRASTVTFLKQQGFTDSDIMRVTGHASSALIYAYDKSSRADNASKKVNLIF